LPPDAARSPERVTVRDSAGIRIVTHPAGPFNDTISPVPLLTIGQEGEPEYEFFRLAHVVSLGSGNVVVANGGTHELRLYESDGRYLRTVGRRGGGPAEWGFLSTVWVRTGDTLAVVDPRRRRMVYFDSAGTFVRGESFAGDLGSRSPEGRGPCFFPGLMGLLSDGARLIRGWGCMMFEGRVGRRPTIQSMVLVRPDRRDSIGAFNVGWIWERGPTPDPRDSYSLIPFSGAMRHAVGDDRIYLSEGTEMEIKVFDRYGRHVGILREDTLPPPVTRAHRDTYVSERAASSRPHPGDVPFPDRFGSYFHLILSYEGDLWARRYPRPGDELQHWVVFPARDEPARRLVVPDIRVQSVRDGRIYGYRSDTLGIQTVVVLDAGL
jgi:hypothetical protein